MKAALLGLSLLLVVATPASAQHGLSFKFGIPDGFELADPTYENERSVTFRTSDGDFMEVREVDLGRRGVRDFLVDEMRHAQDDGWQVTYKKMGRSWGVYSGIRNGQIRYVRGIRTCRDRAAFFLIDYAREKKRPYDRIILRMIRSLKAAC